MRVTAETKAATRQQILDAAQTLFADKGFEATTTRDIAQAAKIATGTLFNYFPTKEAIVTCLVGESLTNGQQEFQARAEPASSLAEELFAYVAAGLRKLRPFRKYLVPMLETTLCPLAGVRGAGDANALRVEHLETVTRIAAKHGFDAISPVAVQLYWTLYIGALAFWAADKSPKQEDTLALLDQSLEMFVGWLQKSKE